jgi:hypothetical protein
MKIFLIATEPLKISVSVPQRKSNFIGIIDTGLPIMSAMQILNQSTRKWGIQCNNGAAHIQFHEKE